MAKQLELPQSLAYWLRRLEQANPRVAAVIRRTQAKQPRHKEVNRGA
jgi:hypothetical protein